ncbi:hypothetical protein AMST5_03900 [freshwater sediment metagenome]|uniref:Tetratricopeptide repeat protein n=1 Tax=freshwater sediment metagenome TaxID=556182 RepID=A0AA48M4Q3_9ZZZZ
MKWVQLLRESRRQAFVDLARKAVTLQPSLLSTQEALGSLLLAACEYDEAIQVLSRAVVTLPTAPTLHLMLADAYFQKGESALAWSALQRSPISPGECSRLSIERLTLGLRILECLNAFDDAAKIATNLLQFDPVNEHALRYLANYSRSKGNLESVLDICQAALAHQTGNTSAYYELALTFALMGRRDEAQEMMNLNQFINVLDLENPCSYRDAFAFESALAAEIASDETLKSDPPGTSTQGGFHTDLYLPHSEEQTSLCDLICLIQSQVECFAAELKGPPESPFVKRRPEQARLNAWAVVHPSHGRQTSHIHPQGWLSGVYYVSAPKGSIQGARPGSLVLGPVDEELNFDPPWGVREINPAPGRLVLFPSYIPHATIPSGSPEPRICVAFDVIPWV